MRRQRGWMLWLVMTVIVACLAMGSLAATHLATRAARFRHDERRVQALWLARSAALRKSSASRTFRAGGDSIALRGFALGPTRFTGDATVPRVGSAHVEVTLGAGGRVVAVKEEWRAAP